MTDDITLKMLIDAQIYQCADNVQIELLGYNYYWWYPNESMKC